MLQKRYIVIIGFFLLASLVSGCCIGDNCEPTPTPTLPPEASPTPAAAPVLYSLQFTCPSFGAAIRAEHRGVSWEYTVAGAIDPVQVPNEASINVMILREDAGWYFVHGGGAKPNPATGNWFVTGWVGDAAFPIQHGESVQIVVILMDDDIARNNDRKNFNAVDWPLSLPEIPTTFSRTDPIQVTLFDAENHPDDAPPVCMPGTTSAVPDTVDIELPELCWIAYGPTHQDPPNEKYATEDTMLEDLQVLSDAGFTGLITYSAYGNLANLATQAGFEGVIIGISNPNNFDEIQEAINAKDVPILWGYSIGNEGLTYPQGTGYTFAELEQAMNLVSSETGKYVTTTEPWGAYQQMPQLFEIGDWVFPNVHPFHEGILTPNEAVAWSLEEYEWFVSRANGRPVLFKETGLPTDSVDNAVPGLSEDRQADFYKILALSGVRFSYFEAFDQPWKDWGASEPYWGLFTSERSPKPAASIVCGQ